MKIGLLITSVGDFGQKGFYNAQELGLAKALDGFFEEVVIYKLVPASENFSTEKIIGCNNTVLNIIPAKKIGNNGYINLNNIDCTIDALVYFSDTQLTVPKIYKWCKKHGIKLIPYIGVVESHSSSRIKKFLMDLLFMRNVSVYKKNICMVKTPQVAKELNKFGVEKCKITPVGLDLSIVHKEFTDISMTKIKDKLGYEDSDKVLLFIGRLVPEKQPLKLIDIFEKIYKIDSRYKLIIVGAGALYGEVQKRVIEKKLSAVVRMISKIHNNDIWELYRASNAFINLNEKEIFGMAILEAMYYKCKVVAWEAPGPNFIIEDGASGLLCKTQDDVINGILTDYSKMGEVAHNQVLNRFSWQAAANQIINIVKEYE